MKKIMFNDALELTLAVLHREKTQTRREIKCPRTQDGIDVAGFDVHKFFSGFREVVNVDYDGREIGALEPPYKVGEIVAIAQSYEDVWSYYTANGQYAKSGELHIKYIGYAGWKNKMFVRADLMPHHIKITNIRVERLQDISDEDCLKEGIYKLSESDYNFKGNKERYTSRTAKDAFRKLINQLDRKMWAANPYEWVFEFELVD